MSEKNRIFSEIYETRFWGKGTTDSPLSGPGSTPFTSRPYVNFVSEIIRNFDIKSVLDIGHGDWAMWQEYQFQDTYYLGIDVVEGLSAKNNQLYGNQNRVFLEVSGDEFLPEAELLICKDVLQHLARLDIDSLLSQLRKFDFVLICNDIHLDIPWWRKVRFAIQIRARLRRFLRLGWPFYFARLLPNNSEICSGGYRGVDLESPIFASHFKQFTLLERIDFKAEHPKGTVKRILFYQKMSE